MTRVEVDIRVLGDELQDLVQVSRDRVFQRDAGGAGQLLGGELGIEVFEKYGLAIHHPSFLTGQVVGGVRAETDELGARTVVQGIVDRAWIHTPVGGVQDDAAEHLDVGHRTAYQPGRTGTVLQHIHVNQAAHTGGLRLLRSLQGVDPARAGLEVWPGMHMDVDGATKQLIGQLHGARVEAFARNLGHALGPERTRFSRPPRLHRQRAPRRPAERDTRLVSSDTSRTGQ